MSKSWDYGYVSDVQYIPGYYREQSPNHLNAVCLACGVEEPVAAGEPFTYCELGCGLGVTALTIAATSPQSQVWAFDFNPAHIAAARQLAREGGVENVRFEENSFQDLAEGRGPQDMPQFDYVTLHGVWSWINRENREHIVRFLAKHVKPGGVVYLSYNALPGRYEMDPVRKLLFLLAQDELGPSDQRGLAALKKVKELAGMGARYMPQEFLDSAPSSGSYLSHEYLGEDWPLEYHIDVADAMAGAKLSFVGDVGMIVNLRTLFLTPEQREILKTVSPRAVETIIDYFIKRPFRRDIFVRGRRQLPIQQVANRIDNCVLQLTVAPERISYQVGGGSGAVTLNQPTYGQIFDALKQGPQAIGDLRKLPAVAEANLRPWEILTILVGSGQAALQVPEQARASRENIRRFNSAYIASCTKWERSVGFLACGATGYAMSADLVMMLVYKALCEGTDCNAGALSKAVWTMLVNRGDRLVSDGITLDSEQATADFIAPQLKEIIEMLVPLWQRLGAF